MRKLTITLDDRVAEAAEAAAEGDGVDLSTWFQRLVGDRVLVYGSHRVEPSPPAEPFDEEAYRAELAEIGIHLPKLTPEQEAKLEYILEHGGDLDDVYR
jgi:hypothetical protein